MSSIPRKDPLINEAVEILDNHWKRSKMDYAVAFNTLGSVEENFINTELARCVTEPRYYLENYHVVKTEDQGFTTLYPFWDAQEIFYTEIMAMVRAGQPVKVLVLKARQEGLSTISEGLIFHRTVFNETVNSLIVAQNPSQADYLFSMFTRAFEELPWWMRPEVRFRSKGRYMVFDSENPERRGLKSEIFVEAANKITGVSVGKTIRAAHLSELSDWANAKTLTEQIFPTMNAKDELAIMESTARGRKGFWYDFWRSAVSKWGSDPTWMWKPIFIEWYRCSKYSKPIENKTKFALTPDEKTFQEKVVKTNKFFISDEMFNWKRMKVTETIAAQGDAYGFYQEYPATWMEAFQAAGICAFPKPLLQRILDTCCCEPLLVGEISYNPESMKERVNLVDVKEEKRKNPSYEIPPTEQVGGRLRVWELPEPGESYYIGADVAHGVEGGDFSCAQVIRIGHGGAPDVQVAEWHGWINPTPFGDTLVGLGHWYNMAEIASEVNDVGTKTHMQISLILDYPNLFQWKHYDKVKHRFSELMGWYTNAKTRGLIITALRERIMENTAVLYSYELLDEMLDFSQDDDGGRFEGQDTNDDRVFAMMIALWCAHDSDYGKQAAMSPTPPGFSKYFVLDGQGSVVKEIHKENQPISREEAMAVVSGRAGWSVRRQISTRDFANTDYSPVHDRQGPRANMYYKMGIPAEGIRGDNIIEAERSPAEDDWRAV